jgi:molybdopterin/thiamine biosynthesis adenylyltransferase
MKAPTTTLIFPPAVYRELADDLLSTPDLERAATAFAGIVETSSGRRLLARDWMPVPPEDYIVQLSNHMEVAPTFWARAAQRARRTGEAIVIAHSHPRDPAIPRFSGSDDYGETVLVPKLQARAEVPVAAIVLGPCGHAVRVHSGGRQAQPAVLRVVGQRVPGKSGAAEARFHRQVLALGDAGQAALANLTVGVVGAGGTGSHVAQQLLHLGVKALVVIDPDHVDETNLSRLVGGRDADVPAVLAKVGVVRRMARGLRAGRRVQALQDTIVDAPAAQRLLDCDIVFGCTDSQWARLVLNDLAYQYFVPVVDLGVELQAGGAMGGRVSWLLPDAPCLWCRGVLDPEVIRVEQLPADERKEHVRRGYITGIDAPAPAVVSINGAVASLAVTEFLARLTGFAGDGPRADELVYRLADGTVRRCGPTRREGCRTCGREGTWGAGELASPPWRMSTG